MRLTKRITFGIVLCQTLLSPCQAALPPISVEELAARMRENEAALQSMRVDVQTMRFKSPSGGPYGEPQEISQCQVVKYRMRERFTKEYCETFRVPLNHLGEDVGMTVHAKSRDIKAYERVFRSHAKLQEIEAYDGTIHTQLLPPNGTIDSTPAPVPTAWRLHVMGLFRLTPRISHWQELSGGTWDIDFGPNATHEERECYVVNLSEAGKGAVPGRPAYKLWISPELGFCVVRHQDLRPLVKGDHAPHPDTAYYDFEECAPGVWLPKRYELINNPKTFWVSATFDYFGVNEDIPLDEFIVHFPRGTTITDNRVGEGLIPRPQVLLGLGLPLIAIVAAVLRWRHQRKWGAG